MARNSKIGWTHHTFNPWWGCEKVSPACKHCYAEAWAKRCGHHVWGPGAPRRFFGDKHWSEPRAWNRQAEAAGELRRVFCASQADVLEDLRTLDEHRARLWDLIRETPWLQWLLLTKRPEHFDMVPADVMQLIWAGTTMENQEWAERRAGALLSKCGMARVRFVSLEPLLGAIDFYHLRNDAGLAEGQPYLQALGEWANAWHCSGPDYYDTCGVGPGINWAIIGGESGHHRTELDLQAAAAIVAQCRSHEVPVFFKQDSGVLPGLRGRVPDELWVHEFPRAVGPLLGSEGKRA